MEAMNQDKTTLTHITHLHPLHLAEVPAIASPPSCHACGCPCTDSSIYQCAPCGYVMHVPCARAAKTLRHAAHPDHQLSFRLAPPKLQGSDRCCDACGHDINGPSYHCEPCQFDLHLPCAGLPDTVTVPADAHPLQLVYEDPFKERSDITFVCSWCSEDCSTAQWFYWCQKCDYGGHVGCAVPEMVAKILYPAINTREVQNADAAAALLQQYQQLSLVSSAHYATNTACISAGRSLAGLASDGTEVKLSVLNTLASAPSVPPVPLRN